MEADPDSEVDLEDDKRVYARERHTQNPYTPIERKRQLLKRLQKTKSVR